MAAIIEQGGRFLLVEEETSEGLKLNNAAGHLEPGESPAEGCAREALEETAYAFQPTELLGIYLSQVQRASTGEDISYLRFAFRGRLGAHHPEQPLDTGIVRTLWMTPEEIRACVPRHRSPLLVRCMEDYLAGIAYPLSAIYTDPA